jgi:hypothetical protein
MAASDLLGDQAQALLDTMVSVLDAETDLGAPASQFLTPAAPAFDCEFCAVQATLIAEDFTSPSSILEQKLRGKFGNIIVVSYTMYVVRDCAPVISGGQLPTDAAKTESARIVLKDGYVLWNGIRSAQDTLFDDCLGVYFDGGVPVPERGQFMGWTFQIRASIDGYEL